MRKRKYLLLPTLFLLFLITGCGGVTKEDVAKEKREYIDFQYLDFEALENLGTYPHDKISDKTYENFVKKNKDNYVRWTAPVMEVFPITDIIRLGVVGLPKIHAEFDYDITDKDEKELKKGTILTVSCRPHDYIHGLGGRPTWNIRNCKIEKTTKQEESNLLAFQEKLKSKKADLAKAEKEKESKQKEKEVQEATAQAKEKEETEKPISTDFSSFDNPYDKMTDLQKDEYFKTVKGKYVQWTGEVVDVHEKYLTVKSENETLTFDFMAHIVKDQRDMLLKINKGQQITIKGQLSIKEGVIGSWQLDNAEIVQ